MPSGSIAYIAALGLLATAASQPAAAPPDPVHFNFQVRPLLSDRCFRCHGPDERARKARLRLDTADGARAALGADPARQAIVPGQPEASELWRRITTDDPLEQMPPPESHLSLTPSEKELLRQWIAEGAEYQTHWAFQSVARVPVPSPTPPASHPIDAFVQIRLAAEGLQPAPEASREVLLRRLSLDLTGLPPTPQELDAFLQDTASGAYERAVDRLLASPAYGEQRALEWLDLARYADTYGYQADVDRDLSPWRDWVIRAFQDNLPYDQFILWQLAGDLLPNPTRDQVLATAFNRLHRQTNEGGSVEEEFRAEYAADRVHTTGTAVLGLTLECARCHDHKFDPITQRDYYRLFAFFNNIDESGLYSHFTRAMPSPTLLLYRDGEAGRHDAARHDVDARQRELAAAEQAAAPRFAHWLASGPRTFPPPQPTAHYAFDVVVTNRSPDICDTNRWAELVDAPQRVEGITGHALQFSGDNLAVCKGAGAFDRTQPFSFSLWLKPAERQERAVVFHRSRSWTDSGSRGYELVLEQGRPAFALIHFWPGNAVQVRALEPLPTNSWTHLAITYDGSSRASGLRLYRNGQPLPTEVIRDHLFKDILHRQEWGDADVGNIELTLAGRFRDSGFRHGCLDDLQVFDRRLTALEVAQLAARSQPAVPSHEALLDWYRTHVDPDCRTALQRLQAARAVENALVNDVPEIMVMQEMPNRRPTHVLRRGAYDAPGETVDPGTPDAILPFPSDLPRNRLGLAQWLVDRRHPLTARVAVNRAWRTHFGQGLVPTAEDFGSQGQLPTHPELLDWLAGWFMDHGWDLKALHRQIVLAATYRQDSLATPARLARDPENRLLARGPRHRLAAEQIRDSALAGSGLLNRTVGGPSVRPYQPAGLWEESGTGKTYTQDHGDKLYRRSLYTFWRRTAPPPSMLAFDATSREVCTAKRATTATPIQSLVLLNDPQFVEAARACAEHAMIAGGANPDARIDCASRALLGRLPTAAERRILHQLYQEQLDHFRRDPPAAERYLKIGERPADAALAVPELAATAVLASTLMNLDDFVMKR